MSLRLHRRRANPKPWRAACAGCVLLLTLCAWLTPATAGTVTVPESPAGGAPATVEPPKAFEPAFDTLRRQDLKAAGRDPVARDVERLIERHRGHPRVAEAMLHVASLWECESTGPGGYARDQRASLRWLRAATEAAEPGSDVWNKAHFYLAGRISEGNMAEARALVAKVAKQAEAAQDWVTLAEVESRLMWFCVTGRKIDEAEAHALRLLKWYDDPRRIPDGLAKTDVDMLIRGAAWGMVSAFEEAPWPWEERVERFSRFMDGRAATFLQTIDPTQQERLDRLQGRRPPTPRMRKWTPDPAAPAKPAPAGAPAATTRPAEPPTSKRTPSATPER